MQALEVEVSEAAVEVSVVAEVLEADMVDVVGSAAAEEGSEAVMAVVVVEVAADTAVVVAAAAAAATMLAPLLHPTHSRTTPRLERSALKRYMCAM